MHTLVLFSEMHPPGHSMIKNNQLNKLMNNQIKVIKEGFNEAGGEAIDEWLKETQDMTQREDR